MKKILLGLFCLIAFRLDASHIVGGEFELQHISGSKYELRLIYYFDVINGFEGEPVKPDPKDEWIFVKIFRKWDNVSMTDTFRLPFFTSERVSYYQPDCSKGEVETDKLIFKREIILSASQYNHPDGYYVVWERCCRNYTIDNIYSENPESNPDNYAGQTFYLEFPPVVKKGKPFINSTPELFPPLNDYACVDRLYFADFAGTDRNNDSLVYTIVEPLSTHEGVAVPEIEPAPYPIIKWREGFGLHNIINGNPDLSITKEGLLKAYPTEPGLFVFAVKCEEFRDGEKIGEVRRDFQMLVLDCETSVPPSIAGKLPGESTFSHTGQMNVSILRGEPRCVEVRITDADIQSQSSEKVRVRAVPLNFKANVSQILPPDRDALLTKFSTFATFELCFPECPFTSGPFQIAVIAEDDACALPLLDSLILNVYIEPPPNNKARFTHPENDIVQTVDEWEPDTIRWKVAGVDDDGDQLIFTTFYRGFTFEETALDFQELENVPGSFEGELSWNPDCEKQDYTERNRFPIMMLLDDVDDCNLAEPDTVFFKLTVDLPENNPPDIYIDGLTPVEIESGVERHIFESLDFSVFAVDSEDDALTLYAKSTPIDHVDAGASFPAFSSPAVGNGFVESDFSWNILCKSMDLHLNDELSLDFIVHDDQNKCRFKYADTISLKVKVLPPPNEPFPLIITNENPEVSFENNELTTLIGREIRLNLKATDLSINPQDKVTIDLLQVTGPEETLSYQFTPVTAVGTAETNFIWLTDCSMFQNGLFENDYSFWFRTFDNRCYNMKGDTVVVTMRISDLPRESTVLLPPNIVTPNSDGCNDFFALENFSSNVDQSRCPVVSTPSLPLDNCSGQFASIRIYNRWGKQVFISSQRNFKWEPVNESVGVYFYTIQYNHAEGAPQYHEYKGSITVRD